MGGFLLFRYLPLRKRLRAVDEQRTALKLAIAKGEAEQQQLPLLKEQLRKTGEEIGDFDAKIPRKRNLGVFLQQVTNLMNEHNLKKT